MTEIIIKKNERLQRKHQVKQRVTVITVLLAILVAIISVSFVAGYICGASI